MAQAALEAGQTVAAVTAAGHAVWVRVCHWVLALSFFTLAFTGVLILMVHPRLYWGHVGNDLTPALLELPISDNHRPEGWQPTVPFTEIEGAPFSANRTYGIFNENGWARSLHFLAGWFLVVVGAFYALKGIVTGHIRRDLLPRLRQLAPRALWQDLRRHLRLGVASAASGPPYGLVQKCAYAAVAFLLLPFMVLTGLTMSPAVTAAYPMLLDVFGGFQSARTLHFFGFSVLILFVVVHVAMVILTGFRSQLRAMTLGS